MSRILHVLSRIVMFFGILGVVSMAVLFTVRSIWKTMLPPLETPALTYRFEDDTLYIEYSSFPHSVVIVYYANGGSVD